MFRYLFRSFSLKVFSLFVNCQTSQKLNLLPFVGIRQIPCFFCFNKGNEWDEDRAESIISLLSEEKKEKKEKHKNKKKGKNDDTA